MSGQGNLSSDNSGDVETWDPRTVLRTVDSQEARLANGFLRCHPERWFPGVSERWAPLINTLGCEVRISEIKPTLMLPGANLVCYRGSLDQDAIVVGMDEEGARLLSQEVVPRVRNGSQTPLIVDYIVQRFIAVLGMCQTVSETGSVRFAGRCDVGDVQVGASVRISCSINSNPCSVLIGLGGDLVEKMDKLWRRQVHSSSRQTTPDGLLRLEVAQLGVPPHMLSEYLSKGTVIDLEVRVSDSITLRVGHKAFMPARMVSIDGKLGCQTIQGAVSHATIPEGTSRLSIELASLQVDPTVLAELGQVGACFATERPANDKVTLSINQERVADARLCVYQGRYAVEVL